MNDKVTIYSDIEIIEKIALNCDNYPIITELFRKCSNLCLNMTEDQLDKSFEVDSSGLSTPVGQYFSSYDIPDPYALFDFFSERKDNEAGFYLHDSTAIFFLNIKNEESKSLRDKYGLLVLGIDEIQDEFLQLNFYKYRDLKNKDSIVGSDTNGWNTILDEFPTSDEFPLNAVVVSDNFLMKNRNGNVFCGTANLMNLFDRILPQTLNIPFQIFIICPGCPNLTELSETALKQFAIDINGKRPYQIIVEFLLTEKTPIHRRRIFTNYFSITCEKGFSMFYVNPGNKVRENGNDVRVKSYYHDLIYSSGDLEKLSIYDDLELIKGICAKEAINTNNRLLE